jgi:hypothetical protein
MDMDTCIAECTACHRICVETLAYCLGKGGRHAEARHARILLDCAEICQTSADVMIRGSDLHKSTCRACAEICAPCAESCAAIADNAQMKRCADACRRCAESCREMAA